MATISSKLIKKLPLDVGILAWHSGQTLVNTLTTYYFAGLQDMVQNITILFQEGTLQDIQIAKHFGYEYIVLEKNVGIGKGFLHLANKFSSDNILLLEHDWHLTGSKDTAYERLSSGLELLSEYDVIKYRHRKSPGYPLFSRGAYEGNELNHYDKEIDMISPHLLDSVHWLNPAEEFPDKIQQQGEYFVTTSRWANWTNNPCMFKKDFYIDTVTPYAGEGIDLEGKIAKWWSRQNFKVAHGEGLFTHKDLKKFGQ